MVLSVFANIVFFFLWDFSDISSDFLNTNQLIIQSLFQHTFGTHP